MAQMGDATYAPERGAMCPVLALPALGLADSGEPPHRLGKRRSRHLPPIADLALRAENRLRLFAPTTRWSFSGEMSPGSHLTYRTGNGAVPRGRERISGGRADGGTRA